MRWQFRHQSNGINSYVLKFWLTLALTTMALCKVVSVEQQAARLLQCFDQRSDSLVAVIFIKTMYTWIKTEVLQTSNINSMAVFAILTTWDKLILLALSDNLRDRDMLEIVTAGLQSHGSSGQVKELLQGKHRAGWVVVIIE